KIYTDTKALYGKWGISIDIAPDLVTFQRMVQYVDAYLPFTEGTVELAKSGMPKVLDGVSKISGIVQALPANAFYGIDPATGIYGLRAPYVWYYYAFALLSEDYA